MKHFIDGKGAIRALEEDGSQDYLIAEGWVEASAEDIEKALEPTAEQKAEIERGWRDKELLGADHKINDINDRGGDPSAWKEYRILLRDYPSSDGFPYSDRPLAPAE